MPAGLKTDGLSMVPMLSGGAGPQHESFYWELHERRFIQAVRFGQWKAVRHGADGPIELYDLQQDPAEAHDVATANPQVVAEAERLLQTSRTDDPRWPVKR